MMSDYEEWIWIHCRCTMTEYEKKIMVFRTLSSHFQSDLRYLVVLLIVDICRGCLRSSSSSIVFIKTVNYWNTFIFIGNAMFCRHVIFVCMDDSHRCAHTSLCSLRSSLSTPPKRLRWERRTKTRREGEWTDGRRWWGLRLTGCWQWHSLSLKSRDTHT